MSIPIVELLAMLGIAGQPLGPGDFNRSVKIGEVDRSYLVHVPPKFDSKKPAPIVLCFHGAWANAAVQVRFTGLNDKADQAGFVAVYPNGMGKNGMQFWNAGMVRLGTEGKQADDVGFVVKLLDDLGTVVHIDPKRVYATGMSNGGMMCYRLASELSDRIAAIAAVSGTMAIEKASPTRPVPVMHFHGTADTVVPYKGRNGELPKLFNFKSVEDTVSAWIAIDGCPQEPRVVKVTDTAHDGTNVIKKIYGPGKQGTEVILVTIEGGGHTWPGHDPLVKFLGKTTRQISANDMIWDFFLKHPMP